MNRELNRRRKRTQKNINHAKTILNQSALAVDDHLGQVQEEYHRVVDLSRNAPAIIENIDKAFREKTKLTDTDIVFLMICTALQCVRQYLLTNNKFRLQDLGSMTSSKRGDAMMRGVYDATAKDAALAEMIAQQRERSLRTYGYRRMWLWLWLKSQNIFRNPKTVLRIMKKYDLLSEIRRCRKWRQMGQQVHKYKNLLNQGQSQILCKGHLWCK